MVRSGSGETDLVSVVDGVSPCQARLLTKLLEKKSDDIPDHISSPVLEHYSSRDVTRLVSAVCSVSLVVCAGWPEMTVMRELVR